MEFVADRPLFTDVFDGVQSFTPLNGSAYIYGIFEERSRHVEALLKAAPIDVTFVEIREDGQFEVQTGLSDMAKISLRNREHLDTFFVALGAKRIYVDITGLGHHVWAPLIKVALSHSLEVHAVYVEPQDYAYSPAPRQGDIFDLSERIQGIAPIPLFTTLTPSREQDVCFVPLLGFEGTRLAHMIEQVEPPGQKIFPIVGVPGFRAEYPFHAFLGNAPKLLETEAWKNVRYARANCPFSLFYVLSDILRQNSVNRMKVAPIGTKPHALGAVLASLKFAEPIELVYDHPKRKRERTSGAYHCLVYSVSKFLLNHSL